MNLSSDLEHVVSVYESYFPEISLVRKTPKGPSPMSHIKLRTKEGNLLLVAICEAGWFLLESSVFYETFEALVGAHSRGFRDTFANNLFARLRELTESDPQRFAE